MAAAERSLDGQVALVVGGSGGIGSATALRLAALGARVIITYSRSASGAQSVVAGLEGEGHAAFGLDVTDSAAIDALARQVEAEFGRLDILVNSAGFSKMVKHAELTALDDDFIDRMFTVNWRGSFATIRSFAPLLAAQGSGLIVNVSSIAGRTAVGSNIAYCAVKAGIDVMTKSLARALAPAVRVMAVSPGMVDTEFVPGRDAAFNARVAATVPLKRIATSEDVADAIVACATLLRYSTGSIIDVDGGRSL